VLPGAAPRAGGSAIGFRFRFDIGTSWSRYRPPRDFVS
jgi:hypothetical protein